MLNKYVNFLKTFPIYYDNKARPSIPHRAYTKRDFFHRKINYSKRFTPLYDGHPRVSECSPNTFLIDYYARHDHAFIDGLKFAMKKDNVTNVIYHKNMPFNTPKKNILIRKFTPTI